MDGRKSKNQSCVQKLKSTKLLAAFMTGLAKDF